LPSASCGCRSVPLVLRVAVYILLRNFQPLYTIAESSIHNYRYTRCFPYNYDRVTTGYRLKPVTGPDGRHAPTGTRPSQRGIGSVTTSYNDQEKNFMKQPVRVAITGAAGNIGYAIAFRIAYGDMLGPEQPVILHLLEITPALPALQGVVMELNDCAFPLLQNVVATDDVNVAFKDVNFALLVGARPRGPGMERKDLLTANGAIFGPQGKALNDHAARDVRVVVVGNPANTNSLIAACNAPDLDRRQFTAMTRLDHNRALSQLAEKTGSHVNDINKMLIWGNHSSTQYPDIGWRSDCPR